MTPATHTPTIAEIRGYEIKARQLRADALRAVSATFVAYVKTLIHRDGDKIARPVHA